MSWNFRVVRKTHKTLLGDEEIDFGMYEVYYDKENNPTSISVDPVPIAAESLEGVQWVLDKMAEAMKKPVLNYEDIAKD